MSKAKELLQDLYQQELPNWNLNFDSIQEHLQPIQPVKKDKDTILFFRVRYIKVALGSALIITIVWSVLQWMPMPFIYSTATSSAEESSSISSQIGTLENATTTSTPKTNTPSSTSLSESTSASSETSEGESNNNEQLLVTNTSIPNNATTPSSSGGSGNCLTSCIMPTPTTPDFRISYEQALKLTGLPLVKADDMPGFKEYQLARFCGVDDVNFHYYFDIEPYNHVSLSIYSPPFKAYPDEIIQYNGRTIQVEYGTLEEPGRKENRVSYIYFSSQCRFEASFWIDTPAKPDEQACLAFLEQFIF